MKPDLQLSPTYRTLRNMQELAVTEYVSITPIIYRLPHGLPQFDRPLKNQLTINNTLM